MILVRALAASILAATLSCAPAFAHSPDAADDMRISPASRSQLIETLATEVNNRYVFPDVAKKLGAALREQHQRGAYDGITSARQLSDLLTRELQTMSKDRHLRVSYSAKPKPAMAPGAGQSPEDAERRLTAMRANNFGVKKVEHLPFNIGYLELEGFAPARAAADTLAAAMTLLAHTDALIIDLRNNGGGDAAAVLQLASYLLDKPTHLSDFYHREGERIEPRWTSDAVAGVRYGQDKPVTILTSKYTFSAAEDFSYALKNLKRATIVGETTGGGANPGDDIRLLPHFSAFVPLGRSISPITASNWEAVGVTPDVSVCADDAMRTAQVAILTAMSALPSKVSELGNLRQRIAELGGASKGGAHCP